MTRPLITTGHDQKDPSKVVLSGASHIKVTVGIEWREQMKKRYERNTKFFQNEKYPNMNKARREADKYIQKVEESLSENDPAYVSASYSDYSDPDDSRSHDTDHYDN